MTPGVTLSIKYAAAENLLTTNVFHSIRARPGERGSGRRVSGRLTCSPRAAAGRLPRARSTPRALCLSPPHATFVKQKPLFFNKGHDGAA